MGNRAGINIFLGMVVTGIVLSILTILATGTTLYIIQSQAPGTILLISLLIGLLASSLALMTAKLIHIKRDVENLQSSKRKLEHRLSAQNRSFDQTNRKLVETIAQLHVQRELFKESQNYLDGVLSTTRSILVGMTADGIVTHWNSKASELTGIRGKFAIGRSLEKVISDSPLQALIDFSLVKESIRTNETKNLDQIEYIESDSAQGKRFFNLSISPLHSNQLGGAIIRIEDVSNQVQLEALSIQTEKLIAMGEMTAGIIHELNNPLSTILQSSQNIIRRLDSDLPSNQNIAKNLGVDLEKMSRYSNERGIASFVDAIKQSGQRASQTISQMLKFIRPDHKLSESFCMNELVLETIGLMKFSPDFNQPDKVKFTTLLTPNLPSVQGTSSEMQQVIINLIRNSVQASDGTVNIDFTSYSRGGQFYLEITDNGAGISDDVKDHIFEPFFTTRINKGGTGLGLSVCKDIIEKHHNGKIELNTSTNGTTFIISLPTNLVINEEFAAYA